MFSKAMCAYANWKEGLKTLSDSSNAHFEHGIEVEAEKAQSEYEATVRCLALLVKEPVSDICLKVVGRVEQEFWGWTQEEGRLAESKGGLRH